MAIYTRQNSFQDGTPADGGQVRGELDQVAQATNAIVAGQISTGAVTSAAILDGTIVNADINGSAAIAYSKLNLALSIIDADVNASAAIAQAKLAGTTLNYAQATSDQSIVTNVADITSLSVSVTVPAGGRYIRISGNCRYISSDGPRNMTINIMEGATQLQTNINTASAASAQGTAFISYIVAASSGSHTYKLTGDPNGGTMTLKASSTAPNYILVELI